MGQEMEVKVMLLLAVVGAAVSSEVLAVSDADADASLLHDTPSTLESDGSCKSAKAACTTNIKQHTAFRTEHEKKLSQCKESQAARTKQLSVMDFQQKKDEERLHALEKHAQQLAAKATEQEAQDEGMVMDDEDFGESKDEDVELGQANTAGGLPGIKDALQKAEAVLTYNQIQSDRLYKHADKMASNPDNLTTKKKMKKLKEAAHDAAKAASARFIAEVQVTKLKAAMAAAEKVENAAKSKGSQLGAAQEDSKSFSDLGPSAHGRKR